MLTLTVEIHLKHKNNWTNFPFTFLLLIKVKWLHSHSPSVTQPSEDWCSIKIISLYQVLNALELQYETKYWLGFSSKYYSLHAVLENIKMIWTYLYSFISDWTNSIHNGFHQQQQKI